MARAGGVPVALKVRPGYALRPNQQNVQFGLQHSDFPPNITFPYLVPYIYPVLPPGGTHTAVAHPTVMTDALAVLGVNLCVGFIIYNLTDGSQGVVTANTGTTVTVAALTGGVLNVWTTGDVYVFASRLMNIGTMRLTPYTLPQGFTLTLIEKSANPNQDSEVYIFFDGLMALDPIRLAAGAQVDFSNVVGASTAIFDPTGATAHTLDIQWLNRGLGDMRGGLQLLLILEKV